MMAKETHTPGPWDVFPHYCKNDPDPGPYGETLLIGKGQFDTLAEVRPGSDEYGTEYQANARLIAAAPELLEALEKAVTFYDNLPRSHDKGEGQLLDGMAAAIAKACGETK
tara:strand:+ start:4617 stop:4949 length:333 start_codon:yes stop_codon:yes gene_type:complete